MQNCVTVNIAGQKYTLMAAEDQAYVEKVAAYADSKIQEIRQGGKTPLQDALILTAMNLADEHFHDAETIENLRRQIKEILDDAAQLKSELSDAKRTIFKLQNRK